MDRRVALRLGLIFFILHFGIAGCAENSNWEPTTDGDADSDADSDTDADGDSDADSDSDADGDTDADGDGDGDPTGMPSCFDPEYDFDPEDTTGDGADVGDDCEVTADCRDPLLCIEGECVAPGQSEEFCDGIDIVCPYDGTVCIGGRCVYVEGSCALNIDCPSGYICVDGECRPVTGDCYSDEDCPDGGICDFGECVDPDECVVTSDLRGDWTAESVMHLGEATSGVVGALLSATEWIRDFLEGRDGIPGIGFLIDDVLRDWVENTLYAYQIDAIIAIGDISDLLDDIRFDHQMTLDAPCRELYRGVLTFERLEVEYRGDLISERPENIPSIGAIEPAEFGAMLRCDSMSIDEFRVDHLVAGLIRWVSDVVVQHASEGHYAHLEDALVGVIDCAGIAAYVGFMESAIQAACQLALDAAVDEVGTILDETALGLGLMRIQGEASVPDDSHLEDGHWTGSLLTGDFSGEFTAWR